MKKRPLTPEAKKLAEGCINLARWHANRVYRRLDKVIPLDELTSFAFFALLRAASQYDPVKYPNIPFSPFATMIIARNMSRDVGTWFKKFNHSISLESIHDEMGNVWEPEDHRTPDLEVEVGDKEIVNRVKSQLPKQWFRVLTKRYLDGLSFSAVGRQEGISKQAAHLIEVKAIDRVRKILGDEMREVLYG